MSHRMLADLVGRSEDWVSKVERGVRDVRRLDVVTDLARALRVELGDLLGQPVLVEDDQDDDDIPAVRDALMTPRRLSRTLFRPAAPATPMPVEQAARLVEHAWNNYQQGRIVNLRRGEVDLAAGVITAAHTLTERDDGTLDTAGSPKSDAGLRTVAVPAPRIGKPPWCASACRPASTFTTCATPGTNWPPRPARPPVN